MATTEKRGFHPPRTFETDISSYVAAMEQNAGDGKPWGVVPGNGAADLAGLKQCLQSFVPLRQMFEQKRREYEGAKAAYVEAGHELWDTFFTALEHARAAARQKPALGDALEPYKRKFTRREPPVTPADKPADPPK